MTDFDAVNCYSDDATQSKISTTEGGYLPSDAFTDVDTASKVYPSIKYSVTSDLIPSPFKLVDGELVPNEEYYTTDFSSKNALSDFAGPYNTNVLIDLATAQSDWKTINTAIKNKTIAHYYPAACCCARFGAPDNSSAPKGTSSFLKHKTDNEDYDYSKGVTDVWYMPACGELGFIVPHRSMNDSTITNVKSLYPLINVDVLGSSYLWNSSEYSNIYARYMYTEDGHVGYCAKYRDYLYVRAFCAI